MGITKNKELLLKNMFHIEINIFLYIV